MSMQRDSFRHPKPAAVSGPNDAAKIFIGGLHKDTTDHDMRTYFSQFGSVVDSVVKKDAASGNSRGFGFVQFADVDSVDRVMNAKPHTIQGKTVDTKRTKSKAALNSCSKIFVGGLDPSMAEDEIRAYFERFGAVESMELPYDRERNVRRGFCFISFEDPDAVEIICTTSKHRLGSREVDVKRATTKEQRMQGMGMANMIRPGGMGDPFSNAAMNPWAVGYPNMPSYDYASYYAQQAAQYAAYNSQMQQAANGAYQAGQDPYGQPVAQPQPPYYAAAQMAQQQPAGGPAFDYANYYGGPQGGGGGAGGHQSNGSGPPHKSGRVGHQEESRRYQPY